MRFSGVHGGSEAVGSSDVLVVGPHSDAMVAEYDSQLRGMSVVLEPWLVFTLAKVSMTSWRTRCRRRSGRGCSGLRHLAREHEARTVRVQTGSVIDPPSGASPAGGCSVPC